MARRQTGQSNRADWLHLKAVLESSDHVVPALEDLVGHDAHHLQALLPRKVPEDRRALLLERVLPLRLCSAAHVRRRPLLGLPFRILAFGWRVVSTHHGAHEGRHTQLLLQLLSRPATPPGASAHNRCAPSLCLGLLICNGLLLRSGSLCFRGLSLTLLCPGILLLQLPEPVLHFLFLFSTGFVPMLFPFLCQLKLFGSPAVFQVSVALLLLPDASPHLQQPFLLPALEVCRFHSSICVVRHCSPDWHF
mmetsp:Transcript_43042/g.99682  ORF Transcript_43042/g.99682 Transcript_43042/m.99682 type:complete len:249 (+) Transcript_43042:99-845(+)